MDTLEISRAAVRGRIAALRTALSRHHLDAVVVPTADPHLSEYLPARWAAREWLSGFTGSMATLVVTPDFAGLWVDSRYWVQADAELAGTGIEVMRINSPAAAGHIDWIAMHVPQGARVTVDGSVMGLAGARALSEALKPKQGALVTDLDLVGEVWLDRPPLPQGSVSEHLAPNAVVSRQDKLASVRAAMERHGANAHLVSSLDDIAWIFNLRGSDVSYNPVFVAHALIEASQARIFTSAGKIAPALASRLQQDGVTVHDYADIGAALGALGAGTRILIDPRRVTYGVVQAVGAGAILIEATNPSTFEKSRKTDAEVARVREAMQRDGAALCEFFSWLEHALPRQRVTELTIDEEICAARARQPDFVSPSFSTIAAFNANGAMPHYRATADAHAVIEGDGLLLIDSGGQYLCGTTDITRVIPIGTPSAAQMTDYTLVLKGMINLSRARFPRGTRSPMLDVLARAPIWAAGVDYGHGTGHGVGYFLNVHEGPQVIGQTANVEPQTAMEVGMITSNEPGIYRPGQWGVRIENLVVNRVAETTAFGEFLCFETLTLCPIDTRCIDLTLMRADEIDWLNQYHATVRERLSPLVQGAALDWLHRRTEALTI